MDAGTEGSFPEPGAVTHSAESDFDIPSEVESNHLDNLCRDEDNSDENPSTQRIDFKTQIGPQKNRVTRTTRTYADRTRRRN
jgi:hypothetical protein